MRKYVVRLLALVMIITVMSTMAVSASAAENDNSSSMQDPRVSSPFPFALFVQNASYEINTSGNSAKQFTKAGISESNVTTYGKLILTRTDGKYTAGIGYLNGANVAGATGLYVSNYTNNVVFSKNYAVSNLVAGRTYFLYAKNDSSSSCTMHGTITADVY